ncbi:MAG: ATP-binding cassette domain-containing protein [Candidatus Binatia bacterium]|nr:ATP-binding cassette domain-containing protein [Candidatus Binatia bacterium]
MARARIEGLTKRYGDAVVLDDFSLDIADGELVVVVGPSGCGKSTLLRLLAGLDEQSAGEIHLGDRRVDGLAPQHRDVAMVFQNYALYPHMTVRGNVEFPLRMRGVGKRERRVRAEEVAELLEIGEFLDRRPAALSGGQRQRVALARALVREPDLFLLDEPLSNLDARLRTDVRQHIRDLQRRLGVTTLYVTHDQTEAMTLGHRVVVLDHGRTQMVAPPLVAYERPENAFVAGFLGAPAMNLVPGRVDGGTLRLGEQSLELPAALAEVLATGVVTVGVRPEAFGPSVDGSPDVLAQPKPATVEALGSETLLAATLADRDIAIRLPGNVETAAESFSAPIDALHFFSPVDGRRLAP